MDDAQKQLADKLKTATNVLVTVSRDPSVDQLSALIGLTLFLTKNDKHAAAVFSGNIPSTIEFLKPEETIEADTNSLRDFIIALDKNKADKLRYKVEDNVVRIFITPYKTSITKDDFEFSQGDFNVDLVVALGVKQQEDLDEAIIAHGRILHDAAVASINVAADGGLGTINWHDPKASSLSELVTRLGQAINDKLFDEQISTALLTGIVAETDRFSNEKTSPMTMSASATLMSAGANQQLVASKLQDSGALASIDLKGEHAEDGTSTESAIPTESDASDMTGSMEITHQEETAPPETKAEPAALPEIPAIPETPAPIEVPAIPETPTTKPADLPTFELPTPNVESLPSESALPIPEPIMPDPPGTPVEQPAPGPVPLVPPVQPITPAPLVNSDQATTAPPLPDLPALAPDPTQPKDEVRTHETLTELEQAVASPHLSSERAGSDASLGTARDEVNKALNDLNSTETPQASQSVGAVQFGKELRPSDLPSDPTVPAPPTPPTDDSQASTPSDPTAPPPVPPPIPFQFGNPPPSQ